MNTRLIFLIVLGIAVIYHVSAAALMADVAERKGYGQKGVDVHAVAKCLIFGIVGCIYVAALPSRIEQLQNEKIALTIENLNLKKHSDK